MHQESTELEDFAGSVVVDHPAGAKESESSATLGLLEGKEDLASYACQGKNEQRSFDKAGCNLWIDSEA